MVKPYSPPTVFSFIAQARISRFAESFANGDAMSMSNSAEHQTEQDLDQPTLYEVEQTVATITLNMAERKNSLSNELVTSLGRNLEIAYADPEVRVIVLTNNGNTFCAGADLKSDKPGVPTPDDQDKQLTFVDIFNLILDGPKPVIGRIDGHATGGGVGLVAVCDISVMRDDAKFGFTEVRLGVAPAVISVVCLPKMNLADAMELFLTGERITPDRASEVGLINRSVKPTDLDAVVDNFVDLIRLGGPNAISAAKSIVRRVPAMNRQAAFDAMSIESQQLFRSEEATAGIAAFRDRQPAPWAQDLA